MSIHRLTALRWGIAELVDAMRCPLRIPFPSGALKRSEVKFANISANPDLPLSLMTARVLINAGAFIGRNTTPGCRILRA
jgi:hypothetical protein